MQHNVYAIILCGGSGSRLWPRSRSKHPKHLLKLNGARTLVQETVARLNLPPDQLYCITEQSHAALLREQLPDIPKQNIIVEPGRRGTASAVGLALAHLQQHLDPAAVVAILPADSLIGDTAKFRKTMQAWMKAAVETKRIITIGITPTYPSTGFGYVHSGSKLATVDSFDVYETKQFVEKPDRQAARTYLESGQYLWNAGMFAAPLDVLQREMNAHMPKLMDQLTGITKALAAGQKAKVNELYLALENDTIDYALLEKSHNLGVIPATVAWADVGSWADLHDMLERDRDGNVFDGEYVDIDSHNCFIYSPHQLVATIGLDNLVVINTKDAILICPKDRSQDVKKVVEKLKATGRKKYV